jgi:hypothetical protein
MFIDDAMNLISGAPAERNVSSLVRETDLYLDPLERKEIFGGRASRWTDRNVCPTDYGCT